MAALNGTIGLALFDDEYIQDPYPLYERMHAAGPVHAIGTSGFHAVSSWDAINEVIARPADFSSNLTASMTYADGEVRPFPMGELGGEIQALATADDPSHAVHRKLLVPQLAAKKINSLEKMVVDTIERLWNDNMHDGSVEWMAEIANRLPMMVVTRLIGVPEPNIDELMRWGYASTKVVEGLVNEAELAEAGLSVMELSAYINEHFQAAASNPQDNLLGDLATALANGELSEMTALTIMLTLFSAGGESTGSLMGSAAYMLASRPDVQHQLRENADLLGPFLEEVLRYEPPFRGHYRHVVNDTSLFGVTLPAGSRLVLLWGAANRDPEHFEDANEFRLDRRDGKSHIAFGKGTHFCVGAALARLEARIVIRHLLEHTSHIESTFTGRWLPSLLVRRLERLQLKLS